MTNRRRVVYSTMFACAIVATLVLCFFVFSKKETSTAVSGKKTLMAQKTSEELVSAATMIPEPSAKDKGKTLQDKPLEEILAEEGEDPGAVYYMSRVREAIREGNPAFAREIFMRMKEEHPASILVGEAETLFERGR